MAKERNRMARARQQSEAALREHEARYRAVVETSRDGFCIVHADGRLLEVNDAYARRSGYTRAELLGMNVSDLDAKISPAEVKAHIEVLAAKGGEIFESLHRAKDGSLWPVEVSVNPRADRSGEMLVFVRDISERKRADVILRTRMRLAELGQAGDIDGLLQAAVDAAEEITGSQIGFFHFVDPDQEHLKLQAWSTNTLARMCRADGRGQRFPISKAGVWADCFCTRAPVIHNGYAGLAHKQGLPEGHAPVVRELVVPIIREGRVTEIMGVGNKATDYVQADADALQALAGMVQDLVERIRAETALKASEEQNRMLLSALPEGVLTHRNGRIEYVNQAMLNMLGLNSAAAIVGRGVAEFVQAPMRGDFADATALVQPERPLPPTDVRLVRGDGSLLDAEVTDAHLHSEGNLRVVMVRDIGARKRAETQLRTLSRAVEQSPASIVITDRAGTIEYVNPRFEQVTGYSSAEALGNNPRMLKSGRVPGEVYARLWEAITAGGEWRGELCNRRKNGELFWEFAAISGLRGDDGKIEHYVAVKEDVSARKAYETQIQRLGNLYAALSQCNAAVMHCTVEQDLFQNVCEALVNFGGMGLAWIGLADQADKLLSPAASYGDTTGYLTGIEIAVAADKPTGRGPGGTAFRENRPVWCQDILQDPSMEPWRARVRAAGWSAVAAVPLHRGKAVIGTLSMYALEPAAFPSDVQSLVIEIAANVDFALENFTHEAERAQIEASLKESESRLSAIFKASPLGIIVTGATDGRILEVNDAALRLFGRERDSTVGRAVPELGFYVDPGQHEEMTQLLLASGGIDRFQVAVYLPDGVAGLIEISGRVIVLQGRQCLVATMLDISERRRLEEAHLQAQKLESLGTLAGGIAHDFNNILAAIRGNADLVAQELGPEHAVADSLEKIRIASVRAQELVRRIMAFGRPKESRQEVVALDAVVTEVLKLLRSVLRAEISLNTAFAPDTPHVLADAGGLHEAVVNLTTNAAYAIGKRAGTIEYRLEPVQVEEAQARAIPGLKAGRYARLTVSDDGCGMDAATLARIFDVFYTTKPVGEGTGLGLSMVHGIMRSHGGAVAVQSEPGEGSRFALYFPAAKEQAAWAEKNAAAQDVPRSGKRVLYVDDEESLVILANRVLERRGHTVSTYTEPEEALAALRARPWDFDVVVTDLSMPHMSGFEFAIEALALRPELPVLMTTGYISVEDEISARALGIREVILKPVTMDELGGILDRLLREEP